MKLRRTAVVCHSYKTLVEIAYIFACGGYARNPNLFHISCMSLRCVAVVLNHPANRVASRKDRSDSARGVIPNVNVFSLAVVQFVVFIGGVVSQLTSGAWLKNLGFIPPYWFIFACHAASVLWAVFMVPESKQKSHKKKMRFFSFDSFRAIWSVYRKPRNGGRKNLIMLLISDGIITLGVMGISGVVALFVLRTPLCWGPGTLGVFMAFRFFIQGFGGIAGIGILKRFMSEINVIRIGMVSQCASLVFFAFSDRTWMVFLGKKELLHNRFYFSQASQTSRILNPRI